MSAGVHSLATDHWRFRTAPHRMETMDNMHSPPTFSAPTIVSGATGLIGSRLLPHLHHPTALSRSANHKQSQSDGGTESINWVQWNSGQILDPATLPAADAVVHLAGEPIAASRWTTETKQKIRDSRVIVTRCLVKSMARMNPRPSVLVAASAVGYYGHRPGETLDEESAAGEGFLADVCEEWEAEAAEAEHLGIRVCRLRLGVVLHPTSGALEKMLPFFKLGIAGPLGTGRQHFPWVHIDDVIGLILHCLQNNDVSGPVNAVAPQPITNLQFTRSLGRVLHRPTLLPVSKFGLKVMYGDFADALFEDQKVLPNVAMETHYQFQFENVDSALKDLLVHP